jgi:hypothetical protein
LDNLDVKAGEQADRWSSARETVRVYRVSGGAG